MPAGAVHVYTPSEAVTVVLALCRPPLSPGSSGSGHWDSATRGCASTPAPSPPKLWSLCARPEHGPTSDSQGASLLAPKLVDPRARWTEDRLHREAVMTPEMGICPLLGTPSPAAWAAQGQENTWGPVMVALRWTEPQGLARPDPQQAS